MPFLQLSQPFDYTYKRASFSWGKFNIIIFFVSFVDVGLDGIDDSLILRQIYEGFGEEGRIDAKSAEPLFS